MARIAKRLTTAASVEAVKPNPERQIDVPDVKVRGLALRVTPAGGKTWALRYRNAAGLQRRLGLGRYPAVSLSAARLAANAALLQIAGGGDPAGARQAARAAGRAGKLSTVADLIDAYLADAERGRHRPNGRPKRPGTLALDRYYFERHIKPKFGKTAIGELSRSQVQRFLDGFDAPSSARHCRAVLRQAYNWAIRNELAAANPAQLTSLPAPGQRERVLTDAELKAVWRGVEDPVISETGFAIRLAMVTLQRGGEVAGIHARELDRAARLWTLPGSRAKNHRTHIVPLSDSAVAALDAAFGGKDWKGYAFAARKGSKAAHMGRGAITRALRRLTVGLGIQDATPHDLRRTGATALTSERIGIPRFIVSRVLNQISDTGGAAAVTAIYDRSAYIVEKRQGLDAWAALLAEIVSGKTRSQNVVAIRPGGGAGRGAKPLTKGTNGH